MSGELLCLDVRARGNLKTCPRLCECKFESRFMPCMSCIMCTAGWRSSVRSGIGPVLINRHSPSFCSNYMAPATYAIRCRAVEVRRIPTLKLQLQTSTSENCGCRPKLQYTSMICDGNAV